MEDSRPKIQSLSVGRFEFDSINTGGGCLALLNVDNNGDWRFMISNGDSDLPSVGDATALVVALDDDCQETVIFEGPLAELNEALFERHLTNLEVRNV